MRLLEKSRSWFVVGTLGERVLTQWVTAIMMLVHWGLGIAILVGGPTRFPPPTYQILRDLVGGNTWIWGVSILLSAILILFPFKWINVVGLFIGVLWMNMWMAMFIISDLSFPDAAATPVVTYAGFALINAALLTARVLDRER